MAGAEQERGTVVLEEGDIFFLYRPRVEEEHPRILATSNGLRWCCVRMVARGSGS